MTPKRLRDLRLELAGLRARRRSLRSSDLEGFAKKLGRKRANRGSEPTFVREAPGWLPLSIPGHPGKTLRIGTACNILNQLEGDLDRWENELRDANAGEDDAEEG